MIKSDYFFSLQGCPGALYTIGDLFPFMSWFFGGSAPDDSLTLASFEKLRRLLLVLGFDPLSQQTLQILPLFFNCVYEYVLDHTEDFPCVPMSFLFAFARSCKERIV